MGDPENLPPEVQAALQHLQQMQDQQEMTHELYGHQLYRIYEELTADQLEGLLVLLCNFLTYGPRITEAVRAHIGYTQATMKFRFGVCPYCKEDHNTVQEIIKDDQQ